MPKQLSNDDREWLRLLRERIGGRDRMEKEDWERLVTMIKSYELPVQMALLPYGFGIAVYDHIDVSWAGTPPMVFFFEWWQAPKVGLEAGFDGQERAAKKLAELTHNERNKEILAWYGFRAQLDPGDYTY